MTAFFHDLIAVLASHAQDDEPFVYRVDHRPIGSSTCVHCKQAPTTIKVAYDARGECTVTLLCDEHLSVDRAQLDDNDYDEYDGKFFHSSIVDAFTDESEENDGDDEA